MTFNRFKENINKLAKKIIVFIIILFSFLLVGCNISFQPKPNKYYNVSYYCQDALVCIKTIKENEKAVEIEESELPNIEGYLFVGWDANDDGEVDELPVVTANISLNAIYREDKEYTVAFYLDEKLLNSSAYRLNNFVESFDEQTKESDAMYQYKFIGWDANEDGIAESFPYKVTNDVNFHALFEKVLNVYEYEMYDGETLLQKGKLEYGSKIIYTGEVFKIVDEKIYGLIGWDSNNDGIADDISSIKGNMILKALYTDKQLLIMNIEGKIYAKYNKANEKLDLVSIDLESAQKLVWYTNKECTSYLDTNIMPIGNFYLYGKIEETYSIDTSLLDFVPDASIDSKEEFFLMFNYCIFNKVYNKTLNMNFEFDLDTLLDEARDTTLVDGAYKVETKYSFKKLELTFSYPVVNTTASEVIYEQYQACGLLNYPNTRGSDFNDFYIESVTKTYHVNDSEQLYYCLEHGYRPIISEENTQLNQLYNEMKNVLRLIIDDKMSDYDKALAIYEWMIMEVTYDKKVYNLSASGQQVTQYHCFYLEGVFNEHLAVCDGISKAYAALANMEGIRCVRVTGKGSVNHAWNKICINNNWYVVDATSGGTIINGEFEILTHSFFLVTDEFFAAYYLEDGKYYNGLKAEGVYNYYQNYGFNYLLKDKDFSCDSIKDMTEILNWFSTVCKTNSTCEMYINFDYGDKIDDELQEAMNISILKGISYISNGNVLIIIKK